MDRSPSRRPWARAAQFLREVLQEMEKVNWPTKKELVAYSIVVLMAVIALSSFVSLLDYLFARLVLDVLGR